VSGVVSRYGEEALLLLLLRDARVFPTVAATNSSGWHREALVVLSAEIVTC